MGGKDGWVHWNKGDGEKRMRSRKAGRPVTLHRDTDEAEGEERRLTLMDYTGLFTASAKWPLIGETPRGGGGGSDRWTGILQQQVQIVHLLLTATGRHSDRTA